MCRYFNSLPYKLSSEKSKDEIRLITLTHRIKEHKDRFQSIKNDISQYQGKKFVEMEY